MALDSDVTVYVPYYKAESTIAECIQSIQAQTVAPKRVLIVDDGSPSCCPCRGVEVVRHNENRGLAEARNTALRLCDTSLVACLDADVRASKDWLAQLLQVMRKRDYSGVGGCLVEQHQEALADRWRAAHMAQHWGDDFVDNPRFLYGANNLYRVDRLKEVGGYDPRYTTNNEDRAASEALYAKGYRLAYTPRARCSHLKQDTIATILKSYWRWHHAKALVDGSFEDEGTLIERISNVAFGIYSHRIKLDRVQNRAEFYGVDALIPWIFCSQDLELYAKITGRCVPSLSSCFKSIGCSIAVKEFISTFLSSSDGITNGPWFGAYLTTFEECLSRSGWFDFAPCIGYLTQNS